MFESPLIAAARSGDVSTVRRLARDPDHRRDTDLRHRTALVTAIANDHEDAAWALLENDADTDTADFFGGTALCYAAMRGCTDLVRALAGSTHRVNEPGLSGNPALLHAAGSEHVGAVRELLLAGANPNSRSAGGLTPLMVASVNRSAAIAQLLLEHGAQVDSVDFFGESALSKERNRRETDDFVGLLERSGAGLNLAPERNHREIRRFTAVAAQLSYGELPDSLSGITTNGFLCRGWRTRALEGLIRSLDGDAGPTDASDYLERHRLLATFYVLTSLGEAANGRSGPGILLSALRR